jgi:hypothetical protein
MTRLRRTLLYALLVVTLGAAEPETKDAAATEFRSEAILLSGSQTFVTYRPASKGGPLLLVSVCKKADTPPIHYEELLITVRTDDAKEVAIEPLQPDHARLMEVGGSPGHTATAMYRVKADAPNAVREVTIQRGKETAKFALIRKE